MINVRQEIIDTIKEILVGLELNKEIKNFTPEILENFIQTRDAFTNMHSERIYDNLIKNEFIHSPLFLAILESLIRNTFKRGPIIASNVSLSTLDRWKKIGSEHPPEISIMLDTFFTAIQQLASH